MSSDAFKNAIRNFTMDAAAGDAIRHLTDKGYLPAQIKEALTFPAPCDYIEQVMAEHLFATKKLIPAKEVDTGPSAQYTDTGSDTEIRRFDTEIVERFDSYGKKSFIRVKKESPEENHFSPEDYVPYKNLLVIRSALEQVSSLSDRTLLKVRSTGSHRDM